MNEPKMTLKECIEQLKWCGYECEAGKLECNVAFRKLAHVVDEIEGLYNESRSTACRDPSQSKILKHIITGKCLGIEQDEELKAMGYLL